MVRYGDYIQDQKLKSFMNQNNNEYLNVIKNKNNETNNS